MRFHVVSVFDRVAGVYWSPIFAQSRAAAVRSLGDEVNKPKDSSPLALHPDDYDLYELGEWSDGDALFTTGVPSMICRAADLVRRSE